MFFLFVYEIYREPLNRFAPNSHGRRIWSLAQTSLKVRVKGQRTMSPGTKTAFSALLAVCVRFMFAKTSLASSLFSIFYHSPLWLSETHQRTALLYKSGVQYFSCYLILRFPFLKFLNFAQSEKCENSQYLQHSFVYRLQEVVIISFFRKNNNLFTLL